MTDLDKRPRCPKCGEPARNVVLHSARVVCALHPDGTPGDILSVRHLGARAVEYVCGGGHIWKGDTYGLDDGST